MRLLLYDTYTRNTAFKKDQDRLNGMNRHVL